MKDIHFLDHDIFGGRAVRPLEDTITRVCAVRRGYAPETPGEVAAELRNTQQLLGRLVRLLHDRRFLDKDDLEDLFGMQVASAEDVAEHYEQIRKFWNTRRP